MLGPLPPNGCGRRSGNAGPSPVWPAKPLLASQASSDQPVSDMGGGREDGDRELSRSVLCFAGERCADSLGLGSDPHLVE